MGSGAIMTEKKPEYCVYVATKVDVEVLHRAKAASFLDQKTLQEWISDVLNEAAAKVVRRDPIKRKPPKPHPKHPRK